MVGSGGYCYQSRGFEVCLTILFAFLTPPFHHGKNSFIFARLNGLHFAFFNGYFEKYFQ